MYAKGISLGLDIPVIAINHLKGHIMSCCINNTVTFPFLCLLVSGGNTQIVIAKSYDDIELLVETLDDAIGEAYDKIAKMLNLEYPGGHLIDKYSQNGDINRFKFPKAKVQNLDFSFSGIKTAFKNFLKYNLEKDKFFVEKNFNHICASIQYTLIEMLTDKLELAIEQTKIKNISVGGGVANNNYLRKRLEELCMQKNLKLFLPEKQFCTDNAAMIAFLGYLKFMDKKFDNYYKDVNPDLKY
jgi:N6-L-threonylcarbamoyladenine synthase